MNLIKIFDYNNLEQLDDLFREYKDQVAAVIMEPCVYDTPKKDFLSKAKKITHENESLLIFDEILTGFRLSRGGGQEYFGVIPDMATLGKGIANGMPLGAIIGKTEFMKSFEDVFVSTTFGGEALSLAACIATLDEYQHSDVCGHLWRIGDIIKQGFLKLVSEKGMRATCIGFPPRMKLLLLDENGNDSLIYKSLFLQQMIYGGIFMHPNVLLLSFSHTKEIVEHTLNVMDNALDTLKVAIEKGTVKEMLRGNVAKEVIRRVV
jgi:glutamate-1-semialdehyde 2,1-aminomutase